MGDYVLEANPALERLLGRLGGQGESLPDESCSVAPTDRVNVAEPAELSDADEMVLIDFDEEPAVFDEDPDEYDDDDDADQADEILDIYGDEDWDDSDEASAGDDDFLDEGNEASVDDVLSVACRVRGLSHESGLEGDDWIFGAFEAWIRQHADSDVLSVP